MIDEPLHALFEAAVLFDGAGFERIGGEQWNEPDERPDFQQDVRGIAGAQAVVIEAVLFVPETGTIAVIDGGGDEEKMLEEFAGDVLVGGIDVREVERGL